jgi:hypothetical protein
MPQYLVYGLTVESEQCIPGLAAISSLSPLMPDVRVWLGWLPEGLTRAGELKKERYVSLYRDETGEPTLRVWQLAGQASFWLRYSDRTEFVVDARGQQIWARWVAPLTLEDTATYLLGPVLGFVLRLRGMTCLHASAVAIGDRAIAFLGRAGAGKSTLAAAFARQGYPVLTDDLVALRERDRQFYVQPGYPRLRLWSESAIALFGQAEALPRIVPTHPTWDKRYLDLTQPSYQFQHQAVPLARIYALGRRKNAPEFPQIESMRTQTAMMALVANAYTTYLLDKRMRAAEFEVLSQLVRSVDLRQVNPHADPTFLPQLVEVLLNDAGC